MFDGERVELIDGEIYVMSPMSRRHASGILRVQAALYRIKTDDFFLSVQLPMELKSLSEPEPDLALIQGQIEDFDDVHPQQAALAVEVSLASLQFDRTKKLKIHAQQNIPEYWILNLVDDCLEVYREPAGDSYQQRFNRRSGESISPLAIPQSTVDVASLLPKRSREQAWPRSIKTGS